MKKKYLSFIIVALQILFLSSMVWFHNAKLSGSTRILLKTIPYDPMSIFRGTYVDLRYEISSIPVTLLKDGTYQDLKGGDELFVRLKKEGDYWQVDEAYRRRPVHDQGIYLRGRLEQYYYGHSRQDHLDLDYGIESFFLNEKSAQEVDRINRRWGGDWREAERSRQKRLVQLDEDTRRMQKAGVSEWWFKILDGELEVWLKQGLVGPEVKEAIHNKYSSALEKIKAIDEELRSGEGTNRKPIIVEVAVDREGYGLPTRLLVGDKEYR